MFVNMADKNQPAAADVQEQVRASDKARHIPGGWNFIRGIFTTISCQPTMTDRPGIPLITKLLQSGNFSLSLFFFFSAWKTIMFTPTVTEIHEIQRIHLGMFRL